jgi:hypothetical protein
MNDLEAIGAEENALMHGRSHAITRGLIETRGSWVLLQTTIRLQTKMITSNFRINQRGDTCTSPLLLQASTDA